MTDTTKGNGWALTTKSSKYHCYNDGVSLCGKHQHNGVCDPKAGTQTSQDCKSCWNKLRALANPTTRKKPTRKKPPQSKDVGSAMQDLMKKFKDSCRAEFRAAKAATLAVRMERNALRRVLRRLNSGSMGRSQIDDVRKIEYWYAAHGFIRAPTLIDMLKATVDDSAYLLDKPAREREVKAVEAALKERKKKTPK